MNRKILVLAFVLALAVGGGAGFLAPRQPARASTTATVYVYDGVRWGNGAVATCGWHLDCSGTITAERGLDFISQADPSQAPWFNAWGFYGSASTTQIGTVLIGNDQAPGNLGCPATSVVIRDNSGNRRAGYYYIHSDPGWLNGTPWPVFGKDLSVNGYWNSFQVGNFYSPSYCQSVPHVMTWYAGFNGIYVVPRDPWYNCPLSNPYLPCAAATWQSMPNNLSDWIYAVQYNP